MPPRFQLRRKDDFVPESSTAGANGAFWHAKSCTLGAMIEIQNISKRFGGRQVLDHVSFTAADGRVTGFLGPNGAGKSTTMKAALGLVRPDEGRALIDGAPFAASCTPMRSVGAVLDAKAAHKGRTAYAHLAALACTNNIPLSRVDEVIELTGLESVRNRKAGAFSLGMSQRLSIAAALLGDPKNLILDEPINGLDPEGVKWVRDLCRRCAAEGRAVLLSSHLMSEVALTADDLVIIGEGRILECTTVSDFVTRHSKRSLEVVTPEPAKLEQIFAKAPEVNLRRLPLKDAMPADAAAYEIQGADMVACAHVFAQAQLVLYRFGENKASLEDAYMALTHSHAQYVAKEFDPAMGAMPNQPQPMAGAPAMQPVQPMQPNAQQTTQEVRR